MKRLLSLFAISALFAGNAWSQRLQQQTGRSVVVVNRSGGRSVTSSAGTGTLVSWRKLAQEPEGTTYNVYRRAAGATNYTKVNGSPVKNTNLQLANAPTNSEYAVSAITPDGVEGPLSKPFLYKTQPWSNVWFKFDYDNTVIPRDDYRTKYVWPMDLDGDGEVDAVVADRLFSGVDSESEESSNNSTTTHKIQAYRLDGTLLWTVDMGPNVNICGGHNDMVLAYDINCDGKCEVIVRSSDGTRFWNKAEETWGLYANGSSDADTDHDGIVDYRTQTVKNPPFYISVIDGLTGQEIACNELNYSQVTDGVDHYSRNNRASYMDFGYSAMQGHYGIAYLDGIHPSLVMECFDRETNKTHHYYVFSWGYDWTGGTPSNWHHTATWSRNDKTPWPAEFHQIRIADIDGDGRDEMVEGGYSVNPLTGRFVSAGVGHGDRFIASDIDPDRPGLEVYAIQQSALLGQVLYDASNGKHIKEWYLPSVYDVGRGACMDVDASRKGYEIYSFADDYIYDCKGEKTSYTRSGCGITTMFEGLWWNGDLLREELSSPGGSGWGTNMMVTTVLTKNRLVEFSQESNWATHGGTGTRPAFMGDITGDWREEVILASQNDNSCTGLVGYTSHIPSDHSIYALQQDPHYRLDCTTRGYYQHPNTGFYLGVDMPLPPAPPVMVADLRYSGGAVENGTTSFTTFDMTATAPCADGKSLIFDLSGDNSQPVPLTGTLKPAAVYVMNPKGHDYNFSGDGTLAGAMTLTKSMLGTATFNTDLAYTGKTIVSEGTLAVNGSIAGPVELRAKGTLSGHLTLQDTITFEGALNHEGCRLMPTGKQGVIASNKSLVLPGDTYMEVEAGEGNCGKLVVQGDLTFNGANTFTVQHDELAAGQYLLAECTGTLTVDIAQLKTRGLDGVNYAFMVDGKRLLLLVKDTRDPATDVVWTGQENNVWDYQTANFDLGGTTTFVAGDAVVFNAMPTSQSITLNEMMVTNGVTFNGGTYTFSGEGGLSGQGDVTVNSGANVTFNLKNSDYTGKTIVNGGTLTVPNFYDGGQKSAIGASTAAAGNLQLNGGTLVLSKDNMATNHILTVSDTATIRITQSNSSLSLKGNVRGSGYIVKDGPGQLNFTYGGANNFSGLIVKKGIVAQGAWNATFGRVGSPMVLAGGEVRQIDVNSTSTVPDLNHAFTVEEGTTNKIVGSSRGRISGSFQGKGALTIETKYVRCDVGASFANYEGTLTAVGSQFRLMESVTDLSKARLNVAAGAYIAHYKGGSGNEATATMKIGALGSAATSATDGVLGGSGSTYKIGYLNTNTIYYGLLKAAAVTKEGTGKLSLRTPGHTSPITVNGGTLELYNSGTTALTTATITVANGGTLSGNGLASTVVVNSGGTLAAGVTATGIGTLRMYNLTLRQGATVCCRLSAGSNSRFNVSNRITHNNDTLLIVVPATRTLQVGDELTVFTGDFTTATGTCNVKCESEGIDYQFDTSTLNTDGKVRVSSVDTRVQGVPTPDTLVDVYSADGLALRRQVPYGEALKTLPRGIYVINGRKVVK